MVGCIYIYLHILKTLRARFILFPLSDVGLKVPTSSFLENLKRLTQSLMSGEASRPERRHRCLMIDALVMIATSLCFAKVVRFEQILKCPCVTTNILSSNLRPFHSYLADFCHFALQEIRHSLRDPLSSCWLWRRSQSSEETKPEKRLQCREKSQQTFQNFFKTERICVTMCGLSILHYYMSTKLCRETNFPRIPPPADSAGWSEWHHWGKSSPHLGAIFGQFLAPGHFKAWA